MTALSENNVFFSAFSRSREEKFYSAAPSQCDVKKVSEEWTNILMWNIRGLQSNSLHLDELVKQYQVGTVALMETFSKNKV